MLENVSPSRRETMQLSTAPVALDPVRQLPGSPQYVRFPALPSSWGGSSGRVFGSVLFEIVLVLRISSDRHLPSSLFAPYPSPLAAGSRVLSPALARLTSIAFPPTVTALK